MTTLSSDRAPDPHSSYPSVRLANGVLALTVYRPDAKNGFYRGTRFDWSGMLGRVEYAGHVFWTPWKPGPHDPDGNDDVLGPAEEFDQTDPPGFGEARPGKSFLKIGVGLLVRPDDAPYGFHLPYEIALPGDWEVAHGPDWITFAQSLSDGRGHAYHYVKRVSLDGDRPTLSVEHTLENTGSRDLRTAWYCHNFVNVDERPVGPEYRLRFPISPVLRDGAGGDVVIDGDSLTFARPVTEGQLVYLSDETAARAARFRVEIQRAGVKIGLSESPSEMRLYAAPGAVCPEPFLHLHLPTAASRTWRTDYEFFGPKAAASSWLK